MTVRYEYRQEEHAKEENKSQMFDLSEERPSLDPEEGA
jgi:hypothetical protein